MQFMNILSPHVLEHVDSPSDVIKIMFEWVAPGCQVIAVVPSATSLHRQLAVIMGMQEANGSPSPRDLAAGYQRRFGIGELEGHFVNIGFEIGDRFGYFLKIVPNRMITGWRSDLMKALTQISAQIPPHLLANVGLVARKKA